MRVSYCYRWNELLNEPIDPLSEEEARARHASGELYTALLHGEDGRVRIAIEVCTSTGYFGVQWLNERGLPIMTYVFGEVEGTSRLFLEKLRVDSYDEQGKMVFSDINRFWPDGRWEGRKIDRSTGEVWTSEGSVDVSHNWEPIPEFGEYESITRVERDLPVEQQPVWPPVRR